MDRDADRFGADAERFAVRRFELTNDQGLRVVVSNHGARVVECWTPDASGRLADVVLGFDTIGEYERNSDLYLGCTVGRVANRIADARFELGGVAYRLAANDPPNHLHGGAARSFDKRTWEVAGAARDRVALRLRSPHLEEGYPGEVDAGVAYRLAPDALVIELTATVDRATPINLTHHAYWNLRGQDSGATVLDHDLWVRADRFTPVRDGLIPTGEIVSVRGTALDFTAARRVGDRIDELLDTPAAGYDHNFIVGPPTAAGDTAVVARLRDGVSGRVLEVASTQAGLQLYSGQLLPTIHGKGGARYGPHSGLCLEPQGYPNAVNVPTFPSIIVTPDAPYRHVQVYRFTTEER